MGPSLVREQSHTKLRIFNDLLSNLLRQMHFSIARWCEQGKLSNLGNRKPARSTPITAMYISEYDLVYHI